MLFRPNQSLQLMLFEWSTSNHCSCGLIVLNAPQLDQRMFASSELESLAICLAPGSRTVFEGCKGAPRAG